MSLSRIDRHIAAEAAALGLAYSGGLCWASTCAVASFRMTSLAKPYWSALPGLRTDTCGAIAFIVAAIGLAVSEYLRLRRRQGRIARPLRSRSGIGHSAVLAAAETVVVMSTGLVVYLSVNAVTHPSTLAIQATHFASWPTEGTLRVLALVGCAVSFGLCRYLHADRASGGSASRRSPVQAPSPARERSLSSILRTDQEATGSTAHPACACDCDREVSASPLAKGAEPGI
jgi:hypothetical protein